YSHLTELDGFAWDWGREHGHELRETDRLVGFCLLIKRAVYATIGPLDEQFGIGNFEDDDYCRRALQAGFKAVICKGAFVHHFGGTTFRATGIDFRSLLEVNRRKFAEKYQPSETHPLDADSSGEMIGTFIQQDAGSDRARFPYLAEIGAGPGLRLVPNRIRLSVCMIVRDNENTIRPCLESIRPWVDEIVVVDTGSKDRTPSICEEYGARLFHWAWRDDFSAARNVSFRHARGEWIFWMDSDDTIPANCGKQLRALADGQHPEEILGYVIQVHCPGVDPHDVTVVDHVKLIRNRIDLRFEFRIHEQILPSIRRAGGEVGFTDIHVIHSGSDHSPQTRKRKLERDLRILQKDLQAQPKHPFVLFNLGMTYADVGEHQTAIAFLEDCIDVSAPEESHLRKAYAILVSSLMHLRLSAPACKRLEEGLMLYPADKELQFRNAMWLHEMGNLPAAAAEYQRVIQEPCELHFASRDAGIHSYKARHNLAIVYEEMGEFELAERQWSLILQEVPSYRPAQIALQREVRNTNRPAIVSNA
ncbi:MAG: glycosyl transferase family 2, partial [Planctomycetaceae bacterium]|nr:glycosyl transferase family 2 [Planctomycetaceae bacterium]